jgi:hypothetical protein
MMSAASGHGTTESGADGGADGTAVPAGDRRTADEGQPLAGEIRLVALHEIDAVWPLVAEGMKEACRRSGDDLTTWFLLQSVRRGDALLFVAIADGLLKAALMCRPEVWAERRVLRILALAGADMEAWLPALMAERNWRDALDVEAVVFEGRPGWQRVIKNARVVRATYEVKFNAWTDGFR